MITPTDDWFYLIIFLWSKNLKRMCQNNYLDVGSEKKLFSLNYRISYKRKNLILDSTFFYYHTIKVTVITYLALTVWKVLN